MARLYLVRVTLEQPSMARLYLCMRMSGGGSRVVATVRM
jgi:hypothetical protein